MRYAGLIGNDFVNGEGISTTIFVQGCPHHCTGCHNPSTWDFTAGTEINDDDLIAMIIEKIHLNGLHRNLSISGGEPLCIQNIPFIQKLIHSVRASDPDIKIYCWSGYTHNELFDESKKMMYDYILNNVDVLITGPFIQSQRDITLHLRGSRNQEIWRRDPATGQYTLDLT